MLLNDHSSPFQNKSRWFLAIVVGLVVSLLLGGFGLFRSFECGSMKWAVLVLVAIILTLIMVVYTLFVAKDDPILTVGLLFVVYVIAILGITSLLLPIVWEQLPQFRVSLCPACGRAVTAGEIFEQGHYAAAVDQGQACIDDSEVTRSCRADCGRWLARGLVALAEDARLERRYQEGLGALDRAEVVNKTYVADGSLGDAITTERRFIQEAMRTPTPAPSPIPPTHTWTPTLIPPTHTPTDTPTPTLTDTPTPTPTIVTPTELPIVTPSAIYTDAPKPTPNFTATAVVHYCRSSVLRITQLQFAGRTVNVVPHADVELPPDVDVDIIGAAYVQNHTQYEAVAAPIDEVGLLRTGDFTAIGPRTTGSIGGDGSNGLLLRWSGQNRRNLTPGRYALFARMYTANGQYTVESNYDECWTWVVIR